MYETSGNLNIDWVFNNIKELILILYNNGIVV